MLLAHAPDPTTPSRQGRQRERPALDPRIQQLPSTTFCGQRLTRRQIADIQHTVGLFPKLSRSELAHTICVHLRWQTPKGRNRSQLALRLLRQLERLGILTLPPRQGPGRGPQKPVATGPRSAPQPAIDAPLAALAPLQLQLVRAPKAVAEWNEWVQRYHPLGYRQPFGAHLRYYLLDGRQRKLGCLLFDFAARRLPCRDAWIGWPRQAHRPQLHRLVRNARYLLFPWVRVKNLASKALALAARQLPRDWRRLHGYRPVLLETYVDPQRHAGTCYKAASWQCLGETAGRAAMGGVPAKTTKQVWVRPLHPDWRAILLHGPRAALPSRQPASKRRKRQSTQNQPHQPAACVKPAREAGIARVSSGPCHGCRT